MLKSTLGKAAIFACAIFLIALLYRLTLYQPEDPCADRQSDISGAVLADEPGDQDALVNRAIIMKGRCESGESGEKGD